jgi:hypothetical protein
VDEPDIIITWRPGEAKNMAHFQIDVLQIFVLEEGWGEILRARGKTLDSFS